MTILQDRLAWFESLELKSGSHARRQSGACALEAAAYLAGEKWSDHPECVCPTIAAFGRAWNDALDVETRNRLLKPLVPRMVGTRSTPDVQDRRAFMAADWAVRVFTPAWLRMAGLNEDADALVALPELSTVELCKAAMPTIRKASGAAYGAASEAASEAAYEAARGAAYEAASGAASEAASEAASGAAYGAARGAASEAASGALRDTVTSLQASAADLLSRMIDER